MNTQYQNRSFVILACSAVLLCTACGLTDDQRCPKGFFYVPEFRVCCDDNSEYVENVKQCIPVDTDTGDDIDTGPQSVSDAGPDDGGSDSKPHGLGTICMDDGDCAGYVEDFCAYNPLVEQGYCTTRDCAAGSCETGWVCCDCTSGTGLPPEVACLKQAEAGLAQSLGGCTCEGMSK